LLERTLTQQEVDAFVELTGDSNPIHADQGQGKVSEATAVVPGMLMASMFPAIIGSKFPGALYLSQTLKFRRSAAVGTTVLATVTVAKQSGSRITFDTSCRDTEGITLVDGTALALISSSGDG
jgi:3-hydroxybutyryl-CoA dehydratase